MQYELLSNLMSLSINRPGICGIYFIPYNDSTKFLEYTEILSRVNVALNGYPIAFSDVQPLPGKEYFKIESKNIYYEFIEKPKSANAGEYFDILLNLKIFGINEITLKTLRSMHRKEFYVIIKEAIGQYTFIGNYDSGANCLFERSSGRTKSSDANDATIKFVWETEEPCFRLSDMPL